MDGTILNAAIYLTATFAAALVTGVAGFAFRIGCRRRLAARPYADADRNVDHRLRAGGAGHLGLETAARAALEPAVAISVGGGLWRPFGSGNCRMGPSGLRTRHRWRGARALQRV
jgi:hypothetical protein